jgi:hypothetical protein
MGMKKDILAGSAVILLMCLLLTSCDFLLDLAVEQAGGHVLGEADYQEGSPESPVALTIGQGHTGKVGSVSGGYPASYYAFQAEEIGYYRVKITDCSIGRQQLSLFCYNSWDSPPNAKESAVSPLDIVVVTSRTCYLKVVNATNEHIEFTISPSWLGTVSNEGSATDPIELTLGTARAGRVGAEDGSQSESFYFFNISGPEALCDIALTKCDPASPSVSLELCRDSNFTDSVTTTNSSGGIINFPLSEGAYYLKLTNHSPSIETYTIELRIHKSANEGRIGSPAVLTLDMPHAGKVGSYRDSVERYSYYTFTVPVSSAYDIIADNYGSTSPDVSFALYTGSDFWSGYMVLYYTTFGRSNIPLAAGTYYFRVMNNRNAKETYTLLLTTHIPANEGSIANPVTLTLDVPHAAQVDSDSDQIERTSYYMFDIPSTGSYDIVATDYDPLSPNVNFNLYTNPDFFNPDYNGPTWGIWNVLLQAGRYYLSAANSSLPKETFSLLLRTHIPANEGSVAHPVTLVLDTPHAGKAADSGDSLERNSYYSFTVPSSGAYDIDISDLNPSGTFFYLYYGTDSSYSTYTYRASRNLFNLSLNSGTTYYLRFENSGTNATYSLLLKTHVVMNEGSVSFPIPLELGTPHSGKIGPSNDSTEGFSYYTFTADTASQYIVSVSDFSQGYHDIYFELFSDNGFTTRLLRNDNDIGFNMGILGAGSSYYLRLRNFNYDLLAYTIIVIKQ